MPSAIKNTLELLPLVNFRDLGGLPVIGGHVKPNLVARADDLSFIDEEGARAIIDRGTSLILDLRSPQEATFTGRGPLGTSDITYFHQPLTDDVAMREVGIFQNILPSHIDPAQSAELMGQWYASLIETHGENIRIGLQAIADTDGATIFHCVAGKDRTGVFAASLLSLLGAKDETIITDYALTNTVMPQVISRIGHIFPVSDQLATSLKESALITAPALTMTTMLNSFHKRYCGLDSFLREVGVDGELVATLRGRLVA